MLKFKNRLLLFSLSIFLFSCGTDDSLPEAFDYSNKLIGEWEQVTTFNIKDATATPPTYDWYEVEDGFTLTLFEDGTFSYTNFENCTTGEYFYDPALGKIEFHFDCEIDFYGEKVATIIETFAEDTSQNDQLFLMHAYNRNDCIDECNSILKRVN